MPGMFSCGLRIITLKAWRYDGEIPDRLKSTYGYPRGHRLYVKCTEYRQVKDLTCPVRESR